jgi:pimeloyl-ACP methyl ester carboxylesterase
MHFAWRPADTKRWWRSAGAVVSSGMRSLPLVLAAFGAILAACSVEPPRAIEPEPEPEPEAGDEPGEPVPGDDTTGAFTTGTIQINLLYLHGVQNEAGGRSRAHRSLDDLKVAVAGQMSSAIASYQASHPGVTVQFASASANLYTATPSSFHPSDSTDPTLMDDWEVGDPGCTTSRQGDPCTTAYEWRHRLVQEIRRLFPPTAKNIILIGHSTGARTAFEVASNTGPGGVGTFDWGVRDRIAAVVSIHGMIDGLQSSRYNAIGAASFVTTCKNGDIGSVFGASAPGNGWCEYAGNVSGVAAADWVARNKRSRVLISTASCSPSLWTGQSDGSLPFAAQGSPFSTGLQMTPAAGQTFTAAYGRSYGAFCHSTITSASDARHAAAVASAGSNIIDLIFQSAVRVDHQGTISTTSAVPSGGSTPTWGVGGGCPPGDVAIAPTIQVVGVCRHPGLFDGDDHAIANGFRVTSGTGCSGTFQWSQIHDANNSHNATFHWQARSRPGGGGLLTILPPG